MPTREELIAKARKPAEAALRLHAYYKGKIQTAPKYPIRGIEDFSIWYTPGVAAPCRAIQSQPDLVYEHTNKANSIAVVSDGTRVLGLCDIGPEAGLPVMEGKALLCHDQRPPLRLSSQTANVLTCTGALNVIESLSTTATREQLSAGTRMPGVCDSS